MRKIYIFMKAQANRTFASKSFVPARVFGGGIFIVSFLKSVLNQLFLILQNLFAEGSPFCVL